MKMLVSMLLTLGIILFASQYMMKNMGGIPGLTNTPSSGTPKGLKDLGNAVLDKDVTVYQWTDSDGVTHYGGTPPTGQGQYEKKTIHSNTNIMQAQKQVEAKEEPVQKSRVAHIDSVYSPEGIKDLTGDTKDLKDQMNQRTADQEKLWNENMNPSAKK